MNDTDESKAKQRYFVISILRLSGAVMIAIGLAIYANGLWDMPKGAGLIIVIIGIFDFIAVPVILSRRWKSPPEQ